MLNIVVCTGWEVEENNKKLKRDEVIFSPHPSEK